MTSGGEQVRRHESLPTGPPPKTGGPAWGSHSRQRERHMGTAEAGTQAGDSKEAEAWWVRRSVGVRSGVGEGGQ